MTEAIRAGGRTGPDFDPSLAKSFWLTLHEVSLTESGLDQLEDLLVRYRGDVPVFFKIAGHGHQRIIQSRRYRVSPSREMLRAFQLALSQMSESSENDSAPDSAPDEPRSNLVVRSAIRNILESLQQDYDQIYSLSPDQFEELICDLLATQGFDVHRTGLANARDGGVDILAWPHSPYGRDFLIGVQAKHHRRPDRKTGEPVIKNLFATVAMSNYVLIGMAVTNTQFTKDARVFAEQVAKTIRLRDHRDLRTWLSAIGFVGARRLPLSDRTDIWSGHVIELP